ncbi:MAG TPA: winged helix DNA-binding domain-containing protein, partial [Candidatus Dormibacteraeota bacterium]|nr:winged helix DNA-binding domain-containing protein [Candidatus Dormibacteraeota bacterium]
MLNQRALNRALLERQHLLRRRKAKAADEIEHLVAMQAQVPNAPYVGLWTRLEEFRPEELSDLIATRRAVRMGILRNTLHLLTARDALQLRPLFSRLLTRTLASSPFRRAVAGIDVSALEGEATRLMAEKPRTLQELGALLQQRWPGRDAMSLAYGIRHLVPLVQLPPRGLWRKGGRATWATAEQWLGRPLATRPSVERLVLRYLRAFGPATVADMSAWSGLTGLRPVFDRMRPQLRTFQDEAGRELFDLPDGPLPDPETPAPPRFLPEWDNLVIGHDDRTRVIAFDHRHMIGNGMFLVDGLLAGVWRIENQHGRARLTISSFKPLKKRDRDALA